MRLIICDLFESRRVDAVVNLLFPLETHALREASFSLRGCVSRYLQHEGRNKLITARAGVLFRFLREWLPTEGSVRGFPASVDAFTRRYSMTNYGDGIGYEKRKFPT